MRILIAIEPRSYGQVIGSAIQKLRPHLEVMVVEPEDLLMQTEHLRPDLLFSHLRGSEIPAGQVDAWVEFSVEQDRPSTARVDHHLKEFADLELEDLLSIVDETARKKKRCANSADTAFPPAR